MRLGVCVCIYDSREAATVITLFLFFTGVSVFLPPEVFVF